MEVTRQRECIKVRYPELDTVITGYRGAPPSLAVRGALQPTSLSAQYRIALEYDGMCRPRLHVREPRLTPRASGERIPHTWSENEPCLYYGEQWRRGDSIADTIIPWAMLWLVFYESWRVTGEWLGGGVDHGEPQ